jgi:hypothetical protein
VETAAAGQRQPEPVAEAVPDHRIAVVQVRHQGQIPRGGEPVALLVHVVGGAERLVDNDDAGPRPRLETGGDGPGQVGLTIVQRARAGDRAGLHRMPVRPLGRGAGPVGVPSAEGTLGSGYVTRP